MHGVRNGGMGEIDTAVEDAHLDTLSGTLFDQFQDLAPVNKLFKRQNLSPLEENFGQPFELYHPFSFSASFKQGELQNSYNLINSA